MKKKLAIFHAATIILDVIALGVILVKKISSKPDTDPNLTAENGEAKETFSTVNVVAVGDNLIHEIIYKQAAARNSSGYDFSYAYEKIADRISSADLAILNQETVFSTEHNVSGYPQFNSPVEVGEETIRVGFDVFNIGTNHSLDCGENGLISTINYWKQKNMPTTGAYLNAEEAKNITTNEVNGVKFAYVGFTESTNGLSLPSDSEVVLVRASDESYLQEKISRAKTAADVVIVNAHWGEEYMHEPNENQKALAEKLASWGADVIIGTHPHVIQPVEWIYNPDGRKTLVAYSLGNFLSAQDICPRLLGGMLEFAVRKNNSTGKVDITDVIFDATVTHYGYGRSNIRVYPLDAYTDELAEVHGIKNETPSFSLEYIDDILKKVIDPQFLRSSNKIAT